MQNDEFRGLMLPSPPKPLGLYDAAADAAGLVFLSGMLPVRNGRIIYMGQTDKTKGRAASQLAALNALAVLRDRFDSLDAIERVVQVAVYVSAGPGFQDHAFVADGASELFNRFFPDKHSRMVFGVSSLPMNASVELGSIFQLKYKGLNRRKIKSK